MVKRGYLTDGNKKEGQAWHRTWSPLKIFHENLLRSSKLTTFVAEELFEVMQKNASGRWISVTKSLPACFLCSAYLLKLKKLKRTTLFLFKNKWYNSWAIVKCCLPRGWLELISIKRCPELSFKHMPEKLSDRGLNTVSIFNFKSRLFNVTGSDALSPLSVRNADTCFSMINLFGFILCNSFHFKIWFHNVLEICDFF